MKGSIALYASIEEKFNHETDQMEERIAFSLKPDSSDDWSIDYYRKQGSIFIYAQEVEFRSDHVTLEMMKIAMVEGLKAKQQEIRADSEQQCTVIQEKINKLLSLTYVQPSSEGEFAPRRRDNSGAEDAIPF